MGLYSQLKLILCISSLLSKVQLVLSEKQPGPFKESVWGKGLVKEDISWREIFEHHDSYYKDVGLARYNGSVMVYVTPWNSHGYDIARTFCGKFTHIVPVWYQLRKSEDIYYLSGRQDVDQDWMTSLRKQDSLRQPKILPRVIFELQPQDLTDSVLKASKKVSSLLTTEALDQNFDGWVIEVWSYWSLYGIDKDNNFRRRAIAFVKAIARNLHKEKLELHLAVPPAMPGSPAGAAFTVANWQSLSGHLDGISVMTYDFSRASAGPSSPIQWLRSNSKAFRDRSSSERTEAAGKVFLGLNFYGTDFALSGAPGGSQGGSPILSSALLPKLKKHRPKIKWEPRSREHFFEYVDAGKSRRVFFPTLQSINDRLLAAQRDGHGVSIWEIGQGLDYFYDLL